MPNKDNPTDTQAITDAALAGETAAKNGGGDIAVYEARKSSLIARRNADDAIAQIERDAQFASAKLYEQSGRAGTAKRMRENADRDLAAAKVENAKAYSRRLDEFAVANNFLALVGGDEAVAIVGRRLDSVINDVVRLFEQARTVGDGDFIATPTGAHFNITEMLSLLRPTVADPTETVETSETVESVTDAETVEAS